MKSNTLWSQNKNKKYNGFSINGSFYFTSQQCRCSSIHLIGFSIKKKAYCTSILDVTKSNIFIVFGYHFITNTNRRIMYHEKFGLTYFQVLREKKSKSSFFECGTNAQSHNKL